MKFIATAQRLGAALGEHVSGDAWDGRACILQMKKCGSNNWRQMEWIGFYFQFICEQFLSDVMQIPGTKYGRTEFDGFLEFPWDFKAHAMNTSSHTVIVNDKEAIDSAIQDFGVVGLILALGEVEYDDDSRKFQKWHAKEKGGQSKYEKERIARGAWSRKRKTSFALKQIAFIPIEQNTVAACESFQSGFRNSNGSIRRSKILIDL